MDLTPEYSGRRLGLLYPLMLIAAIAVIVFSIVGIATLVGWMPHAMVRGDTAVAVKSGVIPPLGTESAPDVVRAAPVFQCVECGVIESVREIERRGSLWSQPLAAADRDVASAHSADI